MLDLLHAVHYKCSRQYSAFLFDRAMTDIPEPPVNIVNSNYPYTESDIPAPALI